jgi:hypothetical protein
LHGRELADCCDRGLIGPLNPPILGDFEPGEILDWVGLIGPLNPPILDFELGEILNWVRLSSPLNPPILGDFELGKANLLNDFGPWGTVFSIVPLR